MLKYECLFFDDSSLKMIHSLEKINLPIIHNQIHCTFKYLSTNDEIFDEIVEKNFSIFLIGYGCDGKNSGFEVKISGLLKKYYINYDEENPTKLKVPHITASIIDGAEPNDTKNLDFIPLDNLVKITGRFGYWIKLEDKEFVSFEPYLS